MTTFTPLPTPPSRSDPTNFSARADAFLAALVLYQQEMNAATFGESAAALALNLVSAAAGKGDALLNVSAVSVVGAGGVRTRYASINDAITAMGSTPCALQVLGATTLTGAATIPQTMAVVVGAGATISLAGFALSINGTFVSPAVKCFNGSGTVSFGLGATPFVLPEWWGARGDSNIAGTTGTDSTAALQTALNVPNIPALLGFGNYQFVNLTMPNEKALYGMGVHCTALVAKSGSTGVMFTDQGSAAKITIKGVAFYGNNCAYTGGLQLGKTGAFGTEGMLDDVWVRDLPAGFPGIDVTGNVGHFGRILAQETGGLQIIGSANMVGMVQSYGSKGFTADGRTVATNLQLTSVDAMEIEAPYAGVAPLYLSGNASVSALSIAPVAGATYPHLVEIGASCTTWEIGNLNLVFASGAAPTISNGNFKTGSNYFGGNASGKNSGGEGHYSSIYAGQRPQCFSVVITNTAGTIQHAIRDAGGNVATSWASSVSGASNALSNTPVGADGSTAMAAGAKIGSAATNTLWLDVPNQRQAEAQFHAAVVFNSGGTALTCTPAFAAININGVTRTRLALQFYDALSGAAFALSAGSLPSGKTIQVLFDGRLS